MRQIPHTSDKGRIVIFVITPSVLELQVDEAARVQRVEDLGNHKLVSAVSNDLDIKVKVHRDTAIPAEQVHLDLPAENCCVYADEILVQN